MRPSLSSSRSFRAPSPFAIWTIVTIVAASVLTVQGNILSLVLVLPHLPDFLLVLIWLLSAMGWGAATLRITRSFFDDWRLNWVVSIALGLGIESLLILLTGLVVVSSLVGWLIIIAGILLAAWCKRSLAPSPGVPGEGTSEKLDSFPLAPPHRRSHDRLPLCAAAARPALGR